MQLPVFFNLNTRHSKLSISGAALVTQFVAVLFVCTVTFVVEFSVCCLTPGGFDL